MRRQLNLALHFFLVTHTYLLSAQQLIALQLNGEGRVVAHLERNCKWDPVHPSFLKELKLNNSAACSDTLLLESIWHRPSEKIVLPIKTQHTCPKKIQLLDPLLLGGQEELINSKDVYDFVQTPSDYQGWTQINPNTWQIRSYMANPYTRLINDQLKTDEQDRVIQISQFNEHNDLQYQLNYFYTTENQVEHTTQYFYNYDYVFTPPSIRKTEVQTVWVYDEQQRVLMMIRYNGGYRTFNHHDVEKYKIELSAVIKKEGRSFKEFDSLDIREVLLYSYGQFGIENVLRCQQVVAGEFFPTYYERRYLTDSVFYDPFGRILKYVTHQNQRDEKKEVIFHYNLFTGQVKHLLGNRIQRGNWYDEDQAEQWLNYNQKALISYSKLNCYKRIYKRPLHGQTIVPPRFEKCEENWYIWPKT